jgi:hypothetical protein
LIKLFIIKQGAAGVGDVILARRSEELGWFVVV